MKYLIFLDIDGTVLSPKGIHPRTVNAIAKARALGHKVFINTGRSYHIIPKEVKSRLELDGIVCGLGTCIAIDGEILLSEYVSREDVKTIMDFAKKHSNRLSIEGENGFVSYCGPCFLGKEFEVFSYEDMYERFPDIKVSKFALERRLNEEEIKELSDRFPVFNHPHYAEVGIAGHDKATGMRDVARLLKIDDLHFAYPADEGEEQKEAIRGISLEIKRGEFVALLGHNGSGKSTLAKLLNGILIPVSGAVYVDGMNTADEDKLLEIRKKAGMVFQNPDNQIVATVVEEDVAFACENMGLPSEEIRRRVDTALETVGMSEFKLHAPHLLSGGQKQRVAIAGVLAMEPEIIILDEPTAMLDPKGRQEVMKAITALNREKGMTIVLITHHMDEAAQASRVVVIDQGKAVLDDTPEKVFSQVEEMRSHSLDVPQTVELMHLLDDGLDLTKISVAQCADEIEKYLS